MIVGIIVLSIICFLLILLCGYLFLYATIANKNADVHKKLYDSIYDENRGFERLAESLEFLTDIFNHDNKIDSIN